MSKEIAQTVGGKKIAYLIAILAAFAVLAYLATNGKVSEAAEVSDQAPLVLDVSVEAAIPGGATAEVASVGDILTGALESVRVGLDETTHRDDTGGAASFAQLVRSVAVDTDRDESMTGISSISTIGSGIETGNSAANVNDAVHLEVSGHLNGQTVQTATDMNEPVGAYDVPNNDHASKLLSQGIDGAINELFDQTNSILAERSTSTNSWDIGVPNSSASGWDFFRERYGSGEVIASRVDPASEVLAPAEAYAQEPTGGSQSTVPANSSEVDAKSAAGGGATANWLLAALGLGAIAFGVSGVAAARRSI